MNNRSVILLRVVLSSIVSFAAMSAETLAGDLSRYRSFQFGTELPAVAKLAGQTPAQVKVVHSRPALVQELSWRPQSLGPAAQTETAKDVVLSFYNGQLFRIVVSYDRYGTEGLTANDIVKAISAMYGPAADPPASTKPTAGPYGDLEESVAVWEDSQHRFDLIRSSYGPAFRLVGVLKSIEVPAREATLEANRLDRIEAPQREAARIASDEVEAQAKLEKARLANLPGFRP
jgi:hypothetical protein